MEEQADPLDGVEVFLRKNGPPSRSSRPLGSLAIDRRFIHDVS